METKTPPPQAVLGQMINGYWVTQCIHIAAKLGIADLLAEAPATATALAERVGAKTRPLYRLLRALASLGIFAEEADGRFALTPLAEPLRTGVPGSMRAVAIMVGDMHFRAWAEALRAVQTGDTAFHGVFGDELFGYLDQHPEPARVFDEAMTGMTTGVARAMAASPGLGLSRHGTVMDVGGGAGIMLAELLTAHPGQRGINFDLPKVVERARGYLAKRGLGERCEVRGGDFFEAVPEGADAIIMKWILHDWDDAHALAILKSCRRAMREDSRLYLVESVVPPGNAPGLGKLMDINMLVMTGGVERTAAEYQALLAAAGFEVVQIHKPHPQLDAIEAQPI